MLHELTITDLGVIESARLEFGEGLTCVTGETGAGKTMVLTGLGLILGAKTVPATVRTGAAAAVAEAILDVPASGPLAERLADAGVAIEEDGSAVVSRTVGATTRSRAVMGGRTVPQSLLGEVAAELVTVHGQSDQVRLRSAARQRDTLDAYGGASVARRRDEYVKAWNGWVTAADQLRRMQEGADAERAEVARLRDDLAVIDEISPQPGEDEALLAESRVLENAEEVRTGVAAAHAALAGDDEFTVVAAIEGARHQLAHAARHDQELAALEERLAEFSYGATDVAGELASYADRLSADPGRLDDINQRRSDLATLMRRIGVPDLDGVLEYADRARPRVAEDDAWDATLSAREHEEALAREELDAAASALHEARLEAGKRLSAAVRRELAQLAMPDADVAVTVERIEPAAHGADEVTITLASHPGAPHRPIAEAASGGELSRIMLAIEVSLAGAGDNQDPHTPARTFIFDEVDAGVGGKAAVAVGNRLAQLARSHQVIVVTHLAQVAAFASTHIVVAKSTDGSVTRSQVGTVDGEARVQEVARLLSGQEDSTTARAHALELLERSAVAR